MARPIQLVLALCLCVLSGQSAAQALSHDGQRWVEVEVTVFTHEGPLRPDGEQSLPDDADGLSYPRDLLQLASRSERFGIDFAPPAPPPGRFDLGLPELPAAVPPPVHGPEPAPERRDYRVLDLGRDAFAALEGNALRFPALNRRLRDSGRHRLLWHAAWRQPALTFAETRAVFVRGGDRHGEHNELEGSLAVSQIPGGVDLRLNLWFNRFAPFDPLEPQVWRVPAQPFPLASEGLPGGLPAERGAELRVAEVLPLRQVRSITSERLQYFDHPRFGVLVQVRPYELPAPPSRFAGFE